MIKKCSDTHCFVHDGETCRMGEMDKINYEKYNTELAKPKQEPAAHMFPSDIKRFSESETFAQAYSVPCGNPNETTVPLYTSPPQYEPLDFDSIEDCFPEHGGYCDNETGGIVVSAQWLHDFARAIEKRITDGK